MDKNILFKKMDDKVGLKFFEDYPEMTYVFKLFPNYIYRKNL